MNKSLILSITTLSLSTILLTGCINRTQQTSQNTNQQAAPQEQMQPVVAQPEEKNGPTQEEESLPEGQIKAMADVVNSSIQWTGKKKVGSSHTGKVALKEGYVIVDKDGQPVGGKFVIDMTSITNDDVKVATMNEKLVEHLKSDDFFSVATYPEAVFEITSIGDAAMGGRRGIQGNLTMKGTTQPVPEFGVQIAGLGAGEAIQFPRSATATITFDRTLWDVRFGSGKFFEGLGDNLIEDNITLDVNVVLQQR